MHKLLRASIAAAACLTAVAASATKPPPDAPMPRAVETTSDLYQQTSAIVEATVEKLEPVRFGSHAWTLVHLGGLKVHRGSLNADESIPKTLILRQIGAEWPDGSRSGWTNVPELSTAKTYLLFLRNTAWSMSPVVDQLAMRLETVGGKQIIIGQGGGILAEDFTGAMYFSAPQQEKATNAPQQVADEDLPPDPVSVPDLLAAVDAEMLTLGLKFAGSFYDEPLGTYTEEHKPTPAELAPGTPDSPP